MRRERAAGALRLPAYFLGKVLAETPLSLALPALLVCIVHGMAGLVGALPSLVTLVALEAAAASALGTLAGAAAPTLDVGLEGTKALTTLSTVFGGMYFDATTLPFFLRWLPRASIVRVAWDGLLHQELHALATHGVGASAAQLLAANGVGGAEPAAAGGGSGRAAAELLRIYGLLLVGAYVALAAKAPRFLSLHHAPHGAGGGAAAGVARVKAE